MFNFVFFISFWALAEYKKIILCLLKLDFINLSNFYEAQEKYKSGLIQAEICAENDTLHTIKII